MDVSVETDYILEMKVQSWLKNALLYVDIKEQTENHVRRMTYGKTVTRTVGLDKKATTPHTVFTP